MVWWYRSSLSIVSWRQRGLSSIISPPLRWAHSSAAGTHLWELHPQYLPFEVSPEQAIDRYCKWQSSKWLTPMNLLSAGHYTLRPVLLPYWLFTIDAKIHYTGSVAVNSAQSSTKQSSSLVWKETDWQIIPHRRFSPHHHHPTLLVHASFAHRRDFADAMKVGSDLLMALQPIPKADAEAQQMHVSGQATPAVALHPPEMRKAIGWEFALRAAHTIALEEATAQLKKEYNTDHVKGVTAVVSPLTRHAVLVYLPAYALTYVHGETHNVHGERHAQRFHALISGLRGGGIAGDRHISVSKASTYSGGLTLAAMGLFSVLSPLIGADPFMWTTFDYLFPALGVGATAGLIAQVAPNFVAGHAERKLFENEVWRDASTGTGTGTGTGRGPLRTTDRIMDAEEMQRTNLEWMRWEEMDKTAWDAEKKKQWAQHLWEAQHRRRREKRKHAVRQEQAHKKFEEMKDRRRRRGQDPGSFPFSHEYLTATRGRADYKGYYKTLGLDPAGGGVSQEDIKKAFRKAALQWHPDRHAGTGDKRKARDKFNIIRTAYDTLRDPERKKSYDLGQPFPPRHHP